MSGISIGGSIKVMSAFATTKMTTLPPHRPWEIGSRQQIGY